MSRPSAQNSMPVGVILRRSPGVTRWAEWAWHVSGVLPGAPDAHWKELRRDGQTVEFHVGTLPLTLWPSDAEAYAAALSEDKPCLYAVLRAAPDKARPYVLKLVTASPFEAQLYTECGEELVERLAMPDPILAWVRDFTAAHYESQPFVKRKRRGMKEDAGPDIRSPQPDDVYRAPHRGRKAAML